MAEPIRDVEELGKIAYDTMRDCYDAGGDVVGPLYFSDYDDEAIGVQGTCDAVALAIRDRVCPPDHVVVPRAEHDALMAQVERVKAHWPWGDVDPEFDRLDRAVVDMVDAFAAYLAARGTEATDGK